MKYLLFSLILLLPVSAQADDWTGVDKNKHFAVSALLGTAAYAYTHDRTKAFGLAMLPGLVKEIADSQQENNRFSGKDMVWNGLGAAVGVQVGHWLIGPDRITFVKEF